MLILTALCRVMGATGSVVELRVEANRQNVLAALARKCQQTALIGLDPIESRSRAKSNQDSYMISLPPGLSNGLRLSQRFLQAELMRTGFGPPWEVGLHDWPCPRSLRSRPRKEKNDLLQRGNIVHLHDRKPLLSRVFQNSG